MISYGICLSVSDLLSVIMFRSNLVQQMVLFHSFYD